MLTRLRPWLALTGAVAALAILLPPVATLARHYVLAQALQFAVLATVTPALIVLGAPWRGSRWQHPPRLRPSTRGAWTTLIGFIAIAVAWRLPVAVNALVRFPVLTAVEAATLILAGCALWLELVESPPFRPRIARPLRAAFAALPMWVIWANAYIMAFSHTAWFTAFAHSANLRQHVHGLGLAADQQIAAGLLWAIPGLCFVPVVYVSLITWLRDTSDPDHELGRVPAGSEPIASSMPRPPRGWRLSR